MIFSRQGNPNRLIPLIELGTQSILPQQNEGELNLETQDEYPEECNI